MNITIKLIIIVIAIIFFGVSLILLPKLKEKSGIVRVESVEQK